MIDVQPFDAHLHLNMKSQHILDDFLEEVSQLSGFILVLNTDAEKDFFMAEFLSCFQRLFPESMVAVNFEFLDEETVNYLQEYDIRFGIKIHPRLSNITVESFDALRIKLSMFPKRLVVIDCFYYGGKLETHINLELAVYLAKELPKLKFLLAHGGGHKVLEFMLYTREFDNIYYDFSFSCNYLLETSAWLDICNALKYHSGRVCFGSDSPFFTVEYALQAYKKAFEQTRITTDDQREVLQGCIMKLLDGVR